MVKLIKAKNEYKERLVKKTVNAKSATIIIKHRQSKYTPKGVKENISNNNPTPTVHQTAKSKLTKPKIKIKITKIKFKLFSPAGRPEMKDS